MSKPEEGFREWAIVEVMGHTVYAGFCTDASVGGQSYLRVDVPAKDKRPPFTKLLAPGSIFSISPADEETVRAFVDRREMLPFDRFTLQEAAKAMAKKLAGPVAAADAATAVDLDEDDLADAAEGEFDDDTPY